MPVTSYSLERYKGPNTRFSCPACGKRQCFVRYVDSETGLYLGLTVGRCNRENKCGYHFTPAIYFEQNLYPHLPKRDRLAKWCLTPRRYYEHDASAMVSFIPASKFKNSLNCYDANNFAQFLVNFFGAEMATQLIARYSVGTSKKWNGATVFWQIDINGKIRTGKIMLYNATTGKRVKHPYNHISWVHTALNLPGFNLQQCFFGEHLLKDNNHPVAVVESEKTAIIASAFLPDYMWLAAGSLSNLNEEKCQVLSGRSVILFPDLKGFDKWNNKAKELSIKKYCPRFIVSDLLEKNASEEEKALGLDIADFLLQNGYQKNQ